LRYPFDVKPDAMGNAREADDGPRFDTLLREGKLGPGEVRRLAEALVQRHADAERTPDLAPGAAAYARTLATQAELLSRSPRAGAPDVVAAVERARRFLDVGADRLLARAGAARTLASTAPLRLADVRLRGGDGVRIAPFAAPGPALVDDAALELASLSVSFRLGGRDDLAQRLVSHYAGEAEDFDLYRVLDFYEDLCLVERFTVGARPGDPAPEGDASDARRDEQPLLLITSGPVASGKSSLARALADGLGAARSVSDTIRDHLVHGAPGRTLHEAGWADGFSPGFGPHVYAELLRRGELVLETGRSMVLDAGFPTRRERDAARSLARRLDAHFRFIECRVDARTQRTRLEDRDRQDGEAGAWVEIAERYGARFVPPDELAPGERIIVDTSGTLEEALAATLTALGLGHEEQDVPPRAAPQRPARARPSALPRPPGAVTFDCWRTLLVETDWSAAHARRVGALVEAAEQAGRSVTSEVARRVFDEAWNEHMLAWRQGVATGAPEVARAALEAVGIATEGPHFDALVAQWQEASHSGRVRAVEGAREALERIAAAGIPRALVCDTGLTPGHAVRGLLEAQGLLGLLDVCVFSDEIGVPKPFE
jgi:predicted kinase/FMN phosphatase YigB (HAD superfamily)